MTLLPLGRRAAGVALAAVVALAAGAACSSATPQRVGQPSSTAPVVAATTTTVSAFRPYAGTYRSAEGRTFVVTIQGWWVDLATGAARSLAPSTAANEFSYGPGFMVASPPSGRIRFSLGGQGQAAQFADTPSSGVTVVADLVPFTTRDVSIPADGAALAGTVTEAATPGPHPGIVFVHGSGPEVRSDPDLFVNFFAGLGFAVLGYDKRGVGQSTGTFPGERATPANLAVYAQDAAAANRFLHGLPDVDGHRIGFYGGSQAGWVIPLAAGQIPDLAFAVIAVGPAVTVGQQELYASFSRSGDSTPSMNAGEIDAAVRSDHSGYDPAPTLARLAPPVLWLLGGRDLNVPTRVSAANLAALGKANIAVRVLATANHGLLATPDGRNGEDAASSGFAPDLFSTVATWLHGVPGLTS